MGNPYDVGAGLQPHFANAEVSVTAGGAGDGTEVDAGSIDLASLANRFNSVDLMVVGQATLAATETLSIAGNWQDSPDDAAWTDTGDALAATVVATGATGGSTDLPFAVKLGSLDLNTAQAFVRAQVTPTASAGSTDTATVQLVYVLGGAKETPA